MGPVSAPIEYKNRVLASLPALEIKRLEQHLRPKTFNVNLALHDLGETIDTVYFLEDGISSVVVTMGNGDSVEVALIGRDGIVGLSAVMGSGRSANRTFIQLSGSGYSLKAKVLREQYEESAGLRSCLQRALQGYLVQTAQTAACNRVHELPQRLARWLLMCHDRMQSDRLQITHEFLSVMLGTNRSSVTVAAGILQKDNLIEYSHGRVTILDYQGLQHAACECYRLVHEEYVKLGLL